MATYSIDEILNTSQTAPAVTTGRQDGYAMGKACRALGITAFVAAAILGYDAYRSQSPMKAVAASTCATEAVMLAGLGYGMRKQE